MPRHLRCPGTFHTQGKRCNSTNLECLQFKHHYSAFAGYKFTYSDRSLIRCKDCGHCWRTYSDQAENLPHAKRE